MELPFPRALRAQVLALGGGLVAANLAAWAWAFLAFRHFPLQLGTALLAYGFGLRHAVDADHIAAIDNVTRKLMQEGKRPIAVGLFFSLGHSTIVMLVSLAIAGTALAFKGELAAWHSVGSTLGALVSSSFVLAIALMNLAVLAGLRRTFVRVRAGGGYVEEDLQSLLAGGGLLARILRPLFAMITESWHMYPLGFLFGLGFDTATEVGLLGIAAAEASRGMPIWSILVFPALFTAGMSLIDTLDGVLMLGTYGWAFMRPIRKIYYNLVVTGISVLVALFVGGLEALGLLADRLSLHGPFWTRIARLNSSLGLIGFAVIALFVASWAIAAVVYRIKNYDQLDERLAKSAATP